MDLHYIQDLVIVSVRQPYVKKYDLRELLIMKTCESRSLGSYARHEHRNTKETNTTSKLLKNTEQEG